jgi:hypothetical protein
VSKEVEAFTPPQPENEIAVPVDGSGACGHSEPLFHIHAGDTRLSGPPRVMLPIHRSAGKGIRLDDVPPAVDSDSESGESDAASERGAGPAQESWGSPAAGSGEEDDSADEDEVDDTSNDLSTPADRVAVARQTFMGQVNPVLLDPVLNSGRRLRSVEVIEMFKDGVIDHRNIIYKYFEGNDEEQVV